MDSFRVEGGSRQGSWGHHADSSDSENSSAPLSPLEQIAQQRTPLERLIEDEGAVDPSRADDGVGSDSTPGNTGSPWDSGGVMFAEATAARDIVDTALAESTLINRNWNVDSSGMIANDPRIELHRVTELETVAFSDPTADIDKVVFHRTVTTSAESTFNSFETPRGGTHYGTHFVVGRDGTIYQTASLNYKTNHVANGHNSNSIGIEVVGMPVDANGNQTVGPPNGTPVAGWQALTPAQISSTAYLTNSLNSHFGLGNDTVAVHEDLQAKTEGEGRTVLDAVEDLLLD